MSADYPEHYHTSEEPPKELHITLTDNDINILQQKGSILADEGHGYTIVITYKKRLPGRPGKRRIVKVEYFDGDKERTRTLALSRYAKIDDIPAYLKRRLERETGRIIQVLQWWRP